MISAAGRLLDRNLAECSDVELEARFIDLLSAIKARFTELGIYLENPSKDAVAQFISLPPPSKSEVLGQLRSVYQVALDTDDTDRDDTDRTATLENKKPSHFELSDELAAMKSFLWRQGLRVADENFFTKIRDGAIVEIYNLEHRQIYRSWSFFSFCSYSLADILVYDWNTLYSRPAWVISRCFTDICDLLEGRRKLVKMEIPEFLLKENFSPSMHNILLKTRFATAILDQRTGEVRGYSCTQKGTLLSSPGPSSKVSFI